MTRVISCDNISSKPNESGPGSFPLANTLDTPSRIVRRSARRAKEVLNRKEPGEPYGTISSSEIPRKGLAEAQAVIATVLNGSGIFS